MCSRKFKFLIIICALVVALASCAKKDNIAVEDIEPVVNKPNRLYLYTIQIGD